MLSLRQRVPLAPFTTLGVGGTADLFVTAHTIEEVREALEFAKREGHPVFVLGGGSNLVISDAGWRGLVVQIAIDGVSQSRDGEKVVLEAGAGKDWDAFVAEAVAANCGGIECLSGIPGTVGGTPVQNVGAYGQEVSNTITRVTAIDRESFAVRNFSNSECGFAYRTSIFNTVQRERYVVVSVAFGLKPGAAPKIEYADLQRVFAENKNPSLAEVREAVRRIRASKGMLLVEGDPDVHSAGSFFKNPIVNTERFLHLDSEMRDRGLPMPSYAAGDSQRKLSAAWLVEKAGFHKGYIHGNVGISSKHTLAIINRGGAKASEVVSFMNVIRETVHSRFGIELHPEPVFVGFERAATR